MTHPTDDELEAMAQYWDVQAEKAYPLDAMIADEKLGKTAAMLRARKSGAAPMTDPDLTRRSPEDGINRSFDEYYDTQSDVEQDPYGAWDAIQKLSAALEVERAETARRKWEDWRQIATLASDRAEALDAKLKEAVDIMQAWKTAGPDQVYYQAVQKRNAFLASLEGDKP